MKKFLHVMNHPVDRLVEALHARRPLKNKKLHKVAIGVGLMFTGPAIAAAGHDAPGVLRSVLDVFGFFIHGYGSLPIIKVIREKFDIEKMEEKEEPKRLCNEVVCLL